MFDDSLLESAGKLNTKRGRATALSFAVQAALAAALVVMPLVFTRALPSAQLTALLEAPVPPPAAIPRSQPMPPTAVRSMRTELPEGILRTPTAIPKHAQQLVEEAQPPQPATVVGLGVGFLPGETGVIDSIGAGAPPAMPKVPVPAKVKLSTGVMQGNLIEKVEPVYPHIAIAARVQGTVVLQATISKQGTIDNLKVISGHPMLTQAAIDAVRQWRYRPYVLNGEPVEVETQITVNFNLSGA